jgi:hypothetical protein
VQLRHRSTAMKCMGRRRSSGTLETIPNPRWASLTPARYRGVRQALALTSEVFDELPSAPGPPDSGEGTVSGPGRRTVCRKTTSSEQHAREFARASGRLAHRRDRCSQGLAAARVIGMRSSRCNSACSETA